VEISGAECKVPEVCSTMSFNNTRPAAHSDQAINTQSEFDCFYVTAIGLLNQFYSEQIITSTTRDPDYITPEIKSNLRHKNRLMRAGRVEEAGALSKRIGQDIKRHGKTRLSHVNGETASKDLWATVRRVTDRKQVAAAVDGVTAESLNQQLSAISNDQNYTTPIRK
jgi:hypothetical protein